MHHKIACAFKISQKVANTSAPLALELRKRCAICLLHLHLLLLLAGLPAATSASVLLDGAPHLVQVSVNRTEGILLLLHPHAPGQSTRSHVGLVAWPVTANAGLGGGGG